MRGIDLTNMRFGQLVALKLGEPRQSPGGRKFRMWVCRCDCGATSIVRGTSLLSGNTTSCGCFHRRRLADSVRKEIVDYKGAHDRVRAAKGRADDYTCIDCGEQARDWSYDGTDPDEIKNGKNGAYSLTPDCYVPRCRRCHVRHDRFPLASIDVRSTATEGAQA